MIEWGNSVGDYILKASWMWKLPSTNDYSYLESYSVDSVAPVSFIVMVLRYWGQLLIWISLVCACMLSHLSCIRLCKTLWTVACQTPLSMGFSRQEYWKGLPVPSPGDVPNSGVQSRSPALKANSLPTELWSETPRESQRLGIFRHFHWVWMRMTLIIRSF